MEAIIPLMLTAGIGGGLLYSAAKNKQNREKFQDIIRPDVAKAFNPAQNQFVRNAASRFNPLMNLLNPANNPLYPANGDATTIKNNEKKVQNAIAANLAKPNGTGFILSRASEKSLQINTGAGGPGPDAIKKCESIKTDDCDAFEDGSFRKICGICHEEGRDSEGNPTIGGLFVAPIDKESAELMAQSMKSRNAKYSPSVGRCASGRFSVTKQQCQRIKKEIECLKKQTFDDQGCSECYQDETFRFVPTDAETVGARIVLTGLGSIKVVNQRTSAVFETNLEENKQVDVPFDDLMEGDAIVVNVNPRGSENVSIAGYLEGTTSSGQFTVDLIRLVQIEQEGGGRPRLSGFIDVNGTGVTVMRPVRGKSKMTLVLFNPFTFLGPFEAEAAMCAGAPYVTKKKSAEFLASSPCYARNSGPGKYNLKCLQTTFVSAGCDTNGKAYPSDQNKANALMFFNGNPLDIADISDRIFNIANEAYTGRRNGQKLSIPDWNEVSVFCTGKEIRSPCDADDKENGPLSLDCLRYLYDNMGALDKNPGGVGPTYTNTDKTTSLRDTNQRFCTPKGTYSPVLENGETNEAVITAAQKWGGVKNVKRIFNEIHLKANDNTLPEEARRAAIMQCYGVDVIPPDNNTMSNALKNTVGGLFYNCEPQLIADTVAYPSKPTVIGTVDVRKNWILSFTINIGGTVSDWGGIVAVTGANDGSLRSGPASRIPGVWLWPNSTALHVSMLTGRDGWWNIDSAALPMNQDINVVIEMRDGDLKFNLTGGFTQEVKGRYPISQWTGKASVVSPVPGWTQFNGQVKDIKYCSFGTFQNTFDDRTGRTQSPMSVRNFDPRDVARMTKSVSILSKYGGGPWGTWWASGFPDDGTASWIWANAGALQNEPSWNWFKFMKLYTNTSDSVISATLDIAIDNYGSVFVNDENVTYDFAGRKQATIQLLPGENKIIVNAQNQGGPAGFIAIARVGGMTLFVTDDSWKTA
jgi:hypothetical protein